MKLKRCTNCNNDLPLSKYSTITGTTRPRSKCKKCTATLAKEYRELKKDSNYKSRIQVSEIVTDPTRTHKDCKKCGLRFPLTSFSKKSKGNRYACWNNTCLKCDKVYQEYIKSISRKSGRKPTLEKRLSSHANIDVKPIINSQTIDNTLYCAATKIALVDEAKHPLRPTVDNTRITSIMYNLSRGSLTDSEFKTQLNDNSPTEFNPDKLARQLLGRKKRSNIRNRQIHLTAQELSAIIQKQTIDGKLICAASGLPLIIKQGHSLQPSIDRIDNNIDYIQSNIQIVSKAFNIGRNISEFNVAKESWKLILESLKLTPLNFFKDERGLKFSVIQKNRDRQHTPKIKLRPSQCTIALTDNDTINWLYSDFHYIGKCYSKYNIAVFHEGKLIAGLSIRHPSRQQAGDWEISRMCCNFDYRVHGIWSYIMRWIQDRKLITGKLVTYSDNRLFTGNVYEKMGFIKDKSIKADYYWVKDGVRYHKSAMRKTEIEKLTNKTEKQLREEQGYTQVWDMGKVKWTLFIK